VKVSSSEYLLGYLLQL